MASGSRKISEFVKNYENTINTLFEVIVVPNFRDKHPFLSDLKDILADKRDFGIEKYGEKSFQISEENALAVDTKKHAAEELIDYINYMLHEIYKAGLLDDSEKIHKATFLLKEAANLYVMTQQL